MNEPNAYAPPKDTLADPLLCPGRCPACGHQLSLWSLSKPTLSSNQCSCPKCASTLQFDYGIAISALAGIVEATISLCLVLLAYSIGSHLIGDTHSLVSQLLGVVIAIVVFTVCILIFRLFELLCFRNLFSFSIVKHGP